MNYPAIFAAADEGAQKLMEVLANISDLPAQSCAQLAAGLKDDPSPVLRAFSEDLLFAEAPTVMQLKLKSTLDNAAKWHSIATRELLETLSDDTEPWATLGTALRGVLAASSTPVSSEP